ncbi:hypothetical protein OVW18_27070, partial [Klebsiella pneumoniae]
DAPPFADGDVAWLSPSTPLAVSIFADRSYLRMEMAEDASAAGLRVCGTGELAQLVNSRAEQTLADLILVDCPLLEGADIAALVS